MQATLENISAIESKVILTASGEETKAAFEKAYKEVSSKARFDGFRKGHVPRATVLASYGSTITSQAADAVIQQGVEAAYDLISPRVVETSRPRLAMSSSFVEGSEFKFELTIQTTTMLEPKDLSSVSVDVYDITIDESDIDTVVEQLRRQQSRLEVADGAEVADGTVANINFLGKKDGVPFAGGEATNYNLDIDTAQMIPGFIDQIKGHKAGEEFTINCKFPEDYGAEELKGADATFDIKVNSVSRRVLPEVNDDFLKAYGFGGKTVEEFRKSLRQNLEQQADGRSTHFNVKSALNAIINVYGDFEVAEDMLRGFSARMIRSQLSGGKMDDKLLASLIESYMPMVHDEAREQCVIRDLMARGKIDITITDDEVKAVIDSVANDYEDPQEFRHHANTDKDLKARMASIAGEKKLLSELLKLLSVNRISKNFGEFQTVMINFDKAMQERMNKRMIEMAEKRAAQDDSKDGE